MCVCHQLLSGNTVSFYENRESADHVTNEPMSDENSRDPIGADGDSGTANREDRLVIVFELV